MTRRGRIFANYWRCYSRGRRCGASLASMNIIGEFALGQWIFAGAAWGYGWNKGDVKNDKLGLDEARALGKRVFKFVNQWSNTIERPVKS